ncbi:hypothetical protein [Nocardioides coralli]|uniref:hypothetical protein n=1 Tax=Nocardioides coralli TaxID=2872154 RepID=UPI001CA3F281|nr:hypothetical protein [Nocardioides coralli]QZY28669.1 hypothetical protein K6T13_14565 [Nocardioides coralli]
MRPTADSFHALARSSPWRWTSLHVRHRRGGEAASPGTDVEAWLTRPDGVRILAADGRSISNSLGTQRADGAASGPWRPPVPTYRQDGLVARRPGAGSAADRYLDDGLFWESYTWVAMLDPAELSHHVRVEDLREVEVAGRPAWRARLTAETGYAPLCGGDCCELLRSEAGARSDLADGEDLPARSAGVTWPEAYDAALDVATGVVVLLHPVGGTGRDLWLENDIIASA